MTYSILDDGNLVASFDDEDLAYNALQRLAGDPQVAGRLLLVAIDSSGQVIADCAPGERLARAA